MKLDLQQVLKDMDIVGTYTFLRMFEMKFEVFAIFVYFAILL